LIIDVFALGFLTIMLQYRLSSQELIMAKIVSHGNERHIAHAQSYFDRLLFLVIYGYVAFTLQVGYWVVIIWKKVDKHREA
jgi:hypothetical protein